MIPFSILDLSPVPMGSTVAQALRNTVDLARKAEGWGYHRYWLAEHHSLPGVASAATSIVIAQVAAATASIRVGAGGIMLPNHAPLVIAEQFGTLESLFPGRIDLGLGRAPGADQSTARALRRNLASNPDEFPQDVMELMQYFAPVEPGQRIVAIPGAGLQVPLWILGSSLFGAQVAAALGLPPPVSGYEEQLPDNARAVLADVLACSAIGSPATVDKAVRDFVRRTSPDELMLTSQMFDHTARLRSFEIAAQLLA